ncbi:DUF3231 family protein [Virgibacillus phasianinus]|nr:DUF3231 family protein [Virgibacillus phasianinus]
MKSTNHTQLTAPEVANLWASYQNDTMAMYMISYLAKRTEDKEIRSLLEFAVQLAKEHVAVVSDIFKKGNYPIPIGFTKEDVNLDAPKLYSDKLCLYYMIDMAKFALPAYGLALSGGTREDVIAFYSKGLDETQELFKRATRLTMKKGIFNFAPTIPKPDKVDFIKRQDFLSGWFDKRPLVGMEISALVYNTKRASLGEALVTGFSQTAQSTAVRKFFERGKKLTKKHLDTLGSLLIEDDLSPGTINLTAEVTTSTTPPFSDKLMMFHATTFTASGLAQYGYAASSSPRRDLGLTYARLMAETGLYAEDGSNIMIDNGWLEQPPEAADRKKLAEQGK